MIASILAVWSALLQIDSVAVGNSYVPFGNDSFYHARRILDAAFAGGLYQFDPQIHVPEGSWISWPWGYNWLMAQVLQFAHLVSPATDPMKILVYAPVAWIPVNVALLILICSTLGLRAEFRALAAIGFALLPTTQALHGIGQIDHHFVEFTFVLLCALLAMKMMAHSAELLMAASCGVALGVSQAFHHGLFVLQIPVLACIFMLWWQGRSPEEKRMRALAIALVVTTLVVAIPSAPLRDGQFSFSTFSWFHVYIAASTAVLVLLMSIRRPGKSSALILLVAGVILAVPALAGIALGAKFLTGDFPELDAIFEMTSPLGMIVGSWGLSGTAAIYSWLLLLAVPLLLISLWDLLQAKQGPETAFAAFTAFGVTLLLMQHRLMYFGMAFLLAGPLLVAERLLSSRKIARPVVATVATATMAIILLPPLTGGLSRSLPVSGELHYHNMRPLLSALQQACARDPGIVLADRNLGHYIRFHTECSVIANNFLLTEQHIQKVRAVNELFSYTPEALLQRGVTVRYVLTFVDNAYEHRGGLTIMRDLDGLAEQSAALTAGLLLNPPDAVIAIEEIKLPTAGGQTVNFAGLYQLGN